MSSPIAPSRRHRRHHVALEVRCPATGGEIVRVVDDISLDGLRITGPVPAKEGEPVELVLRLPHVPEEIAARGTVVWVDREPEGDRATVGIRFDDLDPAHRVVLAHIFRGGLPE